MRRIQVIVGACFAMSMASVANAQLFNVDLSATANPIGPGAAYPAAAGQAGFWNNIQNPLGTFPLNDLNNLPTGVTMNLDGGGMGAFTGANSAATVAGTNAENLLDDGWDPGTTPDALGNVGVITIAGLAPGNYSVFVYAIAPDDVSFRTGLSVIGGLPAGPITVGGALGAANSFNDSSAYPAPPVAHAIFNKTIGVAENLVINVTLPNIGGTNFATINGLQIVPEPGSIGLLALGALALIKRRR